MERAKSRGQGVKGEGDLTMTRENGPRDANRWVVTIEQSSTQSHATCNKISDPRQHKLACEAYIGPQQKDGEAQLDSDGQVGK